MISLGLCHVTASTKPSSDEPQKIMRSKKEPKPPTFPWRGILSASFVLFGLLLSKRLFPSEDDHERAVSLCRQHVPGWEELSQLPDDNFSVTKLLGGTTHKIYRCDLVKNAAGSNISKAVLRIFRGESFIDVSESCRR